MFPHIREQSYVYFFDFCNCACTYFQDNSSIAVPQTKKRNRFCKKQLRFFLLPMCCYCAFGVFSHLSSHLKNVRCHSMPFCGLSTQWFSSGNMSSSAGTPRSLAALKAAIPCEASMR